MTTPIMPSMTHEGLVTLFRECPDLAVMLAGPRIAIPAEAKARVTSAELSDLQPPEFRADVVVEFHRSRGDRAGELDSAAIVEVQLGPDKEKEYSWPHYVTGFRAQRRCNVTLVAVAITEKMARWCERIIETGHPGFALRPVVIGPELIPIITEAEAATELPELAVLSVAAHGNEPDAERIALAALEGASQLDKGRAALYADLVYTFLGEVARQALENLMQAGKYEYQSEFAKTYFNEGRDKGFNEGRDKGRDEGEARGLLKVLEAKGFEVPASLRDHILTCIDMDLIDQWYQHAVRAERLEDIFDPALLG
jgi:hypothetical protein